MKTSRNILLMVIACCLAVPLTAAPMAGCWDSEDPNVGAGTWQELFAGGGEGQPGNVISAADSTWTLDGATLSTHEWLSDTPTVSMHKTIYTGGILTLNAGGPWENAGDTLPYEFAMGDLVVYTTKTYDANGLTQLIWTIESQGSLVGCETFKVSISAGYAGMPTPFMDGDIVGMTDAIDAIEICISLEGTLRVVPNTLNLGSRGNWIMAILKLGDCIDMDNVDQSSVLLNGTLAPEWSKVMTQHNGTSVLVMKFDRADVEEMVEPGVAKMTITGLLTDGTEFSAADDIRVIERPKPKPRPIHPPKPNKGPKGK